MAKLKNLSNAFKDTKTRTLLIIIIIIVIVAILIGYIGIKRAERKGPPPAATVQTAPRIRSLPGVGTPSQEYIRTQEQENIQRAQQAAQRGTSAIPTITRTTYVGADQLTIPTPGAAGVTAAGATTDDCSPVALARARQAGVKAEELRCKECTPAQLRAAGYTAGELLNAGASAADLRAAGFSASDLRDAGFLPNEIAKAGYAQAELAQSGITPSAISGGLPKDCSPDALRRARAQGVSAAQLKKLGCGAAALRNAGYTAKELKDAGFTAGELRQAGFSAKELKDAGFNAADLREAGFGADELAAAGFSNNDLKNAGFSDGELFRAGLAPAPTVAVAQPVATEAPAAAPTAPAAPAVTPQSSTISGLEALQQRQADQLSQQERQDRITQLQQIMGQQAADLFSSWAPPPKQTYVAGEVTTTTTTTTTAGAAGVPMPGSAVTNGFVAGQQLPVIKAGTIMFAVLDTAVNSDEPSPVLATIVSGPYKGARLLGQFPQRIDKRVILNFTTLSIPCPDFPQSIKVNAVAIDPNTARTALASHVDSHYLLRYGSLFASAFVQGYAEAVQQSGSTTTVSLAGITETHPELDAGDKIAVGLGAVGNQLATSLGNLFTRPPTVTVNSGEGVGILFMEDVAANELAPRTTPPGTPTVAAAPLAPGAGSATTTTTVSGPITPIYPSSTTISPVNATHLVSPPLPTTTVNLPATGVTAGTTVTVPTTG